MQVDVKAGAWAAGRVPVDNSNRTLVRPTLDHVVSVFSLNPVPGNMKHLRATHHFLILLRRPEVLQMRPMTSMADYKAVIRFGALSQIIVAGRWRVH